MTLQSSSGPTLTKSRAAILPVHRGIYSVNVLEQYPELVQGISTRTAPDGDDWNLSARRGTPQHPPDPVVALANRVKLADALGIDLDMMVGCQQVHGSEVAVVTGADAGRGMRPGASSIEGADAMITATPGIFLMVLAADCPPVFLFDSVGRVVGLAHSGWKGTAGRISAKVVDVMVREFGSHPRDIVAVIGPGVGPCCYSVRENVIEQVVAAFPGSWQQLESSPAFLAREGGLVYFNLWAAIKQALVEAGVLAKNISTEAICTAHNTATFYSHRGESGQCGLFGAVIGLRDG